MESNEVTCAVCGEKTSDSRWTPLGKTAPDVNQLILLQNRDLHAESPICDECHNRARIAIVQSDLEKSIGELSQLDEEVLTSMERQTVLTSNLNEELKESLTFGQRVSDKVAAFGGSWTFIGTFLVMMMIWMAFNSLGGGRDHFDPYPFILLNLVLSCVAALQAPIIMMSQNRQEVKDRLRAEADYRTNLKAELEIRQVQEKLDFLQTKQIRQLMELQRVQMEMLSELRSGKSA